MGNENNKEKGSGFFLIAILCGLIIALYTITNIIKEVTYEFKHNTGNTMTVVFIIGVICFIIYKIANTEENTENANRVFCEEVSDFCISIYKPYFMNLSINSSSLEEQKSVIFSKVAIIHMIQLRIEHSSKTDTGNVLRLNENIAENIYNMSKNDLALAIFLLCIFEKKSIRVDFREQSQFLANVIHNRIKREIPDIILNSKQTLSADAYLYYEASKVLFQLADSLSKLNLK